MWQGSVSPPPDNSKRTNRESLERFFRSSWYALLTNVNPEYLMRKLKEEAAKMVLEYTVSKERGNSMYYVHKVGEKERLSKLYTTKKKALHKAAEMQGLKYKQYMKIRRRDGVDNE